MLNQASSGHWLGAKKILGFANKRVRVLCFQHNKLTNKNRTIAASAKLAIAPMPQPTKEEAISNHDTNFSPYANKRSVDHTRSPNHCNYRQSVGLLQKLPARRCGNYLDQQR
ncbi:hypothetical protein [Nostoc flagelliforme]|uniref:hypothetical protein n=1 Tax=Nostoc flagelliforme TaxID=1306274 RepID=UPI0012FE02FC|nr:hypothetical protein [Nostoc flagelliforme]